MSSSCVPCSTTLAPFPSVFSKMQILSAFRIVDKRCAMTMVVRFFVPRVKPKTEEVLELNNPSSAACTSFSDSLSSALVASSSSRTSGFPIIARAMAMRCFCPPLTNPPPTPTSASYPPSISEMNSCAFATLAASVTSARVAEPTPPLPDAMFACTDPLNSVGSCSTSPIFERNQSGSNNLISTPSNSTAPEEAGFSEATTVTDASSFVFPSVVLEAGATLPVSFFPFAAVVSFAAFSAFATAILSFNSSGLTGS
mmetsp:Transcript_10256/g.33921  ORF Transcript_10256/g.33921 Transcript_10256/m.33921 type:complete len:255 (+) Transcript_10256:103-867(+)